MKKKILFIIGILWGAFVFAENFYEVPYVGKKSILTKLSNEEKAEFIKNNKIKIEYDIPQPGEKEHYGFFTEKDSETLFYHDIKGILLDVYKESIPDETGCEKYYVYRLMYDLCDKTNLNLDENDKSIRKEIGEIIFVPVKDKLVEYEKLYYYGGKKISGLQSHTGVEANNIQFRICGDKIYAFYTRLWIFKGSYGLNPETSRYSCDRNSENIIRKTSISDIMQKTPICRVEVDFPLIDKNNPFKYSVQNAYDGDTSTSYVEDTENDLFEINFNTYEYDSFMTEKKIKGFKLINGYAQNEVLYKKNNRIKEIRIEDIDEKENIVLLEKFNCQDGNLSYQNYNVDTDLYMFGLKVGDVYKGTQFSDTCLTEIDFYIEGIGFIFGGE